MLDNRLLESSTTKHLILTILSVLVITVGAFAALLGFKVVELDKLTKFVDAIFKAMAILLGTIWTLNRYYVGRTDTIRLRVDADVKAITYPEASGDSQKLALLLFRLDVVNTGTVLIPPFQQAIQIHSVRPSEKGPLYEPLYRWPKEGTHEGGPIEPSSWGAVNDTISIPAETRAVRIYTEIELTKEKAWTWHKTFALSEDGGGGSTA